MSFGFAGQERHRNRGGYIHGGMLMKFADRGMGITANEFTKELQAMVQFDMKLIKAAGTSDVIKNGLPHPSGRTKPEVC
ncbi:hypothetical protein [Agrobacterium radiobacter]|uniref:hypothetical protein n=1 Tax=Agrobacterium radiobacter TaxID=362 RepID=UPI003F85A2D3